MTNPATSRSWVSASEAETVAVGREVGAGLGSRGCVLLRGPMGSGKTTFVRGLALAAGLDSRSVQSPTFSLVHELDEEGRRLVHLDLYRVKEADFAGLGLLEILDGPGWKAVEWAERLPASWCPRDAVVVEIHELAGGRRRIDASDFAASAREWPRGEESA